MYTQWFIFNCQHTASLCFCLTLSLSLRQTVKKYTSTHRNTGYTEYVRVVIRMGVQIFCDRTIFPTRATTLTWRKVHVAAGEVIASHGFLPYGRAHKWSYLVRATRTHLLVCPFAPILYTGCNNSWRPGISTVCQAQHVHVNQWGCPPLAATPASQAEWVDENTLS